MSPLLYAINIGTFAAWLSISSASTVALLVIRPDRLPELLTHGREELVIVDGDLMDVDSFAGGSSSQTEVAEENNDELLEQQEAVTKEISEIVPDVPPVPEVAEIDPLPEIPQLPERELKPTEDTVNLAKSKPKPKAEVARSSIKRGETTKAGTNNAVAKRTTSGSGTGQGSQGTSGAGSGSSGAARFAGGRKPRPPYPSSAQRQGIEGTVKVSITVDESGAVVSASIISASNSMLNDRAIISTLNRWKFSPGRREVYTQSIKFTLN